MDSTNADPGTSPTTTTRVWDVFPFDALDSLEGRTTKLIHFIRHAEGYHNVNRDYRNEVNLDARLTPKGFSQCEALAQSYQAASPGSHLEKVKKAELVVTSTMTRCVQTALASFPTLDVPFIANDNLRETVNYACDRRRPIREIQAEFPQVDFSEVETNEDNIWSAYLDELGPPEVWDSHRESAELHKVADRGRSFFRWLAKRPEKHIIVCSHSAFLRCVLNYGYGVPLKVAQMWPKDAGPAPGSIEESDPILMYHQDSMDHVAPSFANCELRSCVLVLPPEEQES